MSFIPELVGDGPQPRELTTTKEKAWEQYEEACNKREAALAKARGEALLAVLKGVEAMINDVAWGFQSAILTIPPNPILSEMMHQHFFTDSGFTDLSESITEKTEARFDKNWPLPQQPED